MIWFAIVLAAAVGIAFIPFAKMQALVTRSPIAWSLKRSCDDDRARDFLMWHRLEGHLRNPRNGVNPTFHRPIHAALTPLRLTFA